LDCLTFVPDADKEKLKINKVGHTGDYDLLLAMIICRK